METQDRDLLNAWRGGDASAGSELFRRHFASVARFFESRAPAASVDDLVQSTFERCVAASDKIRDGHRFRAYLLAIARNELLMHFRSRKPAPEATETELVDSARASWLANHQAEQRLVLRALRRLPDELRLAIELKYWEELSLQEIADITEVPANTVKTRLFRARKRLATEIAALEADPKLVAATLSQVDAWMGPSSTSEEPATTA